MKKFIKDNWKFIIKYGMVGATGTIMDIVGFTFLIRYTALGQTLATRGVAATITFIVAVVNNFTWNKLWTFKDKQTNVKKQFAKFLIVSIGGLLLNLTFLTGFSILFASLLHMPTDELPVLLSAGAKLCATGIVFSYNFTLNRFWTFKPDCEPVEQEIS